MFIKIGVLYISLLFRHRFILLVLFTVFWVTFQEEKNIASIIASLAPRVFVGGLKMKMKKRTCFGFQRERLGPKFVAPQVKFHKQ